MIRKRGYRVVKYKPKKKCFYETYEPKKKIKIRREHTIPFIVKIGQEFAVLGGLMGFWASSLLILLRGFFGLEEKIKKFSFNNKVVEIRLRRRH